MSYGYMHLTECWHTSNHIEGTAGGEDRKGEERRGRWEEGKGEKGWLKYHRRQRKNRRQEDKLGDGGRTRRAD